MYELVATHQFSKLLPNHMYELVAPHQFSKLLPNHMYELVATLQFSNLLPNHIHALVRNPLVQQTTAKPYASFSARPTSLANYCQTICMRQCRTHQFFKPLSIEKQISNLVRMMCFQNNLHQVLSMSKDWKAK